MIYLQDPPDHEDYHPSPQQETTQNPSKPKKHVYGKSTIFPSGKLINIGSRSPEQAIQDLFYTEKHLVKNNLIKPIKLDPQIRNLVALTTFVGELILEETAGLLGAIYEPEQFPGAILKTPETNATYLIFQSGKIVISGTSSITDLEKSVQIVNDLLSKYE